jgi:hypothetical protein
VSSEAEARTAGWIVSLVFVVVVPVLLFGPVFTGVSVADIPLGAKVGAAVSALFGLWLAVVSSAATAEDIEKVLQPFQVGTEVVLLFLPLMLWVGTRSVLRRCGWR